ncbi:VWA domain-containing protein [Porphyromonas gingivalis]|uniref:vWA domain-containing protein n=1 Tax=Porphyromonas gingivalis TaxID=837 RepID=UPI00020F014C|nr:VWA domain-containing protein [Porphyromonas gingivalis]ATR98922.1 aerotolerance regulator BatB [Porphyromonas gingivalis]ATS07265.1 aerotolerance regulator BatB [Porphyromonas gingivalis]AUR47978.1 aerotolerance-related exported protein [Porphyromonas gingivalis]MCE8172576.1 VWA domain-containing protein [Porphyromonas gingivalis]OWP32555.1 aerotolerance regulator BatB [Porphyromonas gingivalis]
MFRFYSPEYLYLLLLLPLLVGVGFYAYRKRRAQERRFAELPLLKALKPEASTKRRIWRNGFLLLAIVFLIGMLARPQISIRVDVPKEEKGIEAMICLDISNSMLCEDVKPNRLSFAKQVLGKLFDGLQNDKVGLVVFAGNAYTQIPITTDLSAAKQFLADISPNMVTAQGTAIGAAIELASKSFSDNKEIGKTIIVLTDGENHEGNAIEAAQQVHEAGIRVNVIGLGTALGAPIPIEEGYLKDETGNPVVTKFDEKMCRDIASAGEGTFFSGQSASALVRAIESQLDKLPKAVLSSSSSSGYREVYGWFGFAALICLLLEFLIQERKSRFFSRIKLFDR